MPTEERTSETNQGVSQTRGTEEVDPTSLLTPEIDGIETVSVEEKGV
jgi:hypothetical protein